MRWGEPKPIVHPSRGDRRIRTFFAWFPRTDGVQTRWLEIVRVEEEFVVHLGFYHGWLIDKFLDKDS